VLNVVNSPNRIDAFVRSTSPWTPYQTATRNVAQAIREFDAAFEGAWSPSSRRSEVQIGGETLVESASLEIEARLQLERATGSSGSGPIRETETDMRNNEATASSAILGGVFSPRSENKNQLGHISENAEVPSSRLEQETSIIEPKTSSDGPLPRTERALGAVELRSAAASLLLLASKFWQSTFTETSSYTYLFFRWVHLSLLLIGTPLSGRGIGNARWF
jgi:hypothetical protein